jgi:hypothetical protein
MVMTMRLDGSSPGLGGRLGVALRTGVVRLGLVLAALVFVASALVVSLIGAVVLVPWWLLRGRKMVGALRSGRYGPLRRPQPGPPRDGLGDVVDVEVREVRGP